MSSGPVRDKLFGIAPFENGDTNTIQQFNRNQYQCYNNMQMYHNQTSQMDQQQQQQHQQHQHQHQEEQYETQQPQYYPFAELANEMPANNFNNLHVSNRSTATVTSSVSGCTTTGNGGVSEVQSQPIGMASIPFVQIHTTDVLPQRVSFGNVFRRNISKQEIKSEPIKCEHTDGAATKDGTNAQATSSSTIVKNVEIRALTNEQNGRSSHAVPPANADVNANVVCLPEIYKCDRCPYISLRESSRNQHVLATHSINRQVNLTKAEQRPNIKCPGCSNVFFAHKSLEMHLRFDHQMSDEDVPCLMDCLARMTSKSSTEASATVSQTNPLVSESIALSQAKDGGQRNGRIYLKNVEYLREPNRQPIENTENQIYRNDSGIIANTIVCGNDADNNNLNLNNKLVNNGSNNNHNISTPLKGMGINPLPKKQTISIKSVDVLREPSLLRRHYNPPNLNFGDYTSNMSADNVNNNNYNDSTAAGSGAKVVSSVGVGGMHTEDGSLYNYSHTATNHTANDNNTNDNRSVKHSMEHLPKIYVKSMESFNAMPANSLHSNKSNHYDKEENLQIKGNEMGDNNLTCLSYRNSYAESAVVDTSHVPLNNNNNNNANECRNSATERANMNDVNDMNSMIKKNNTFAGLGLSFGLNSEITGGNNNNNSNNSNNINNNNNNYNENNGDKNDLNAAGNFLYTSTHNDLDNFGILNNGTYSGIGGNSTTTTNYLLENSLFGGNTLDFNMGSLTADNPQLANDPKALSPPQRTSYSKSDIALNTKLRPTATYQEQRGTLHLRTVDELNLMNTNEVQDLIAPNLDSNHPIENVNKSADVEATLNSNMSLLNDDNYKIHGLDEQMAGVWPDNYAELANDIDFIFGQTNKNLEMEKLPSFGKPLSQLLNQYLNRNTSDIDPSPSSLTSIRDIVADTTDVQDFLNQDTTNSNSISNCNSNSNLNINLNLPSAIERNAVCHSSSLPVAETNGHFNLKRPPGSSMNLSAKTERTEDTTGPKKTKILNVTVLPSDNLPPLVPVSQSTNNGIASKQLFQEMTKTKQTTEVPPMPPMSSMLPMPPLLPVAFAKCQRPITQLPTSSLPSSYDPNAKPAEKGRIYVANNLMEQPTSSSTSQTVKVNPGTSTRGRPYGPRCKPTNEPMPTYVPGTMEDYLKCTIPSCSYRFRKLETLEYHLKCHNLSANSPSAIICPTCQSVKFTNWNSLHTHLWRKHKIDMELYSCDVCDFKTPIFSRLMNTHSKIHSADRNYKCEECGKGFKNIRQMRNHRRRHRNPNSSMYIRSDSRQLPEASNALAGREAIPTSSVGGNEVPTCRNTSKVLDNESNNRSEVYCCRSCSAAFSHCKTLREHYCPNGERQLQCSTCEKFISSKSSLRLHMLTHSDGVKRFQCQTCTYAGNDHNAFRRHSMLHEDRKMYACSFCDYQCIQSSSYQKHIHHQHPDKIHIALFKCKHCPYTTVNRSLLSTHTARHEEIENHTAIKPNDTHCDAIISNVNSNNVSLPPNNCLYLNDANHNQKTTTIIKVKSMTTLVNANRQ